ncbi:JmjC domain-containing protein [Alteromonas sp. ASW11-130]|uniref:JmjC domain-containing protein n=1 Tax=Alteromonas sp. ASW11-130 TaxID=3015775 RepID=UPI0022420D9A|nr:cupin domain-containing protein [Alteromonas sp. ASW11-130]MCW8092474.1 AraC family ligand binding domain-containing protein [Alteromonas sp. ASW11-130]
MFLTQYWQKKPVVLKQFFPDFSDFIDEHELAYLAQDSELDSRAIIHNEKSWEVIQGPFDSFTDICRDYWTLLVQGVDKVHPDASELMDAFSFIPYWRMDDLMISFAVEGAGVGPHIDQYDVFLVQGKGTRRWRVGPPGEHKPVHPHPLLSQIEPFGAVIDVELETGDVLYIPPNWPHEGIATSDCVTYSVGFRAPDTESLTRSFDLLFSNSLGISKRYSDPELNTQEFPGLVHHSSIASLRDQLIETLNHPLWEQSLLRMLSEQDLLVEPPEQLLTEDEFEYKLNQGECFERVPACRPIFTERDGLLGIFIEGEYFEMTTSQALVKKCMSGLTVTIEELNESQDKNAFLSLFTELTNKGYWINTSEYEYV